MGEPLRALCNGHFYLTKLAAHGRSRKSGCRQTARKGRSRLEGHAENVLTAVTVTQVFTVGND